MATISKTDCREYRQSGWELSHNSEVPNLSPLYWVIKTIEILQERRSNSDSAYLFITLRGSLKAASRTVIAGWIKSLFKEAGISAPPGSTRSAVASRNWVDNHTLDNVLSQGNWRSENTFRKFYCRKVIDSGVNTTTTISGLFNPVN